MIATARRIHVTGGPGSGKSTLARRIAIAVGAPLVDLDGMLLDAGDDARSVIASGALAARASDAAWVGDGVYFGWTAPLLDLADVIILVDTPASVAVYRIVARHVKAEIARNNRFPGWRQLGRFVRWSLRYYRNANSDALDWLGVPATVRRRDRERAPYAHKLVGCSTKRDADRVLSAILSTRL